MLPDTELANRELCVANVCQTNFYLNFQIVQTTSYEKEKFKFVLFVKN